MSARGMARRHAGPARGSMVVEFALIAMALFLVLVGIVELGRLAWTWNAAVEATRLGARLAAVCDKGDSVVRTRMKEMLPLLQDADIAISYLNPYTDAGSPGACTPANCDSIEVRLNKIDHRPILIPMGLLELPRARTTIRREVMSSSGNAVCD